MDAWWSVISPDKEEAHTCSTVKCPTPTFPLWPLPFPYGPLPFLKPSLCGMLEGINEYLDGGADVGYWSMVGQM